MPTAGGVSTVIGRPDRDRVEPSRQYRPKTWLDEEKMNRRTPPGRPRHGGRAVALQVGSSGGGGGGGTPDFAASMACAVMSIDWRCAQRQSIGAVPVGKGRRQGLACVGGGWVVGYV